MKQYEKDDLIIGGIYRHYKGGMYRVLDVGTFTEPYMHYGDTNYLLDTKMVVYRSIEKEPKTWVRPLVMFKELVVIDLDGKFGKTVKRFEFVE